MRQPWGGRSTPAYRRLLREIREELSDPTKRCPSCEEPGCLTLLEWPERSQGRRKRRKIYHLRQRFYVCILCGHKIRVHQMQTTGKQPIFTELQEQKICRLYEADVSPAVIAKTMYCSRNTVMNVVKKHGVTLKPHGGSKPMRNLTDRDLEQLHYLHQIKGLNGVEIARLLRSPPGTIQGRIRRMRELGWFPDKRYQHQRREKEQKAA